MTKPEVIAVGFGDPERDRRALIWAAREANRRQHLLRVVHAFAVTPANGHSTASSAHEAIMRDQLADVVMSYPGIQIGTKVQAGWSLMGVADDLNEPELTVMAARGTRGLEPLLVGCGDDETIPKRRRTIVVVPDAPVAARIERIVVGADGSPAAETAVQWAADEAELWRADLTIIHAWDYPYPAGERNGAAGNDPQAAELMREDATRLVGATITELRSHRPRHTAGVHAQIVKGPTVPALLDAARKDNADLLVLGARGHGPAALGSTVEAALHRASCAVAVIPASP